MPARLALPGFICGSVAGAICAQWDGWLGFLGGCIVTAVGLYVAYLLTRRPWARVAGARSSAVKSLTVSNAAGLVTVHVDPEAEPTVDLTLPPDTAEHLAQGMLLHAGIARMAPDPS